MYSSFSIFMSIALFAGVISIKNFKTQVNIAVVVLFTLLIIMTKALTSFEHLHFLYDFFDHLVSKIDFHTVLMEGMLSFLLFAGAMTIDLKDIKEWAVEISSLALFSTCLSTVIIGYGMFKIFPIFNIEIPILYCMLFGALISPTDPIAVIAMLKDLKAPIQIQTKIAGESLFNDGVGIVLFSVIYEAIISPNQSSISFQGFAFAFLFKSVLGVLYGFLLSIGLRKLITKKGTYLTDAMSTLILTTGAYTLAEYCHISGPLAMVVAGLSVGETLKANHISEARKKELKHFWVIIDETFNIIIFSLLGLEAITIKILPSSLTITAMCILLCLISRFLTVGLPINLLKVIKNNSSKTSIIIAWGGLRGTLAMALCLSMPESPFKDIFVTCTFGVILFSLIVQGTTIKYLVKKYH